MEICTFPMSFAELTPVASCSSSSNGDSVDFSMGQNCAKQNVRQFHQFLQDMEVPEDAQRAEEEDEDVVELLEDLDDVEEEEVAVKYPYQRKDAFEGLEERIQKRLEDSESTKKELDAKLEEMEALVKSQQARWKSEERNRFFSCVMCAKAFPTTEDLQNHTTRFHDVSRNSEVCKLCGKAYKLRKNLDIHMALHRKEFQCEFCDFVFQSEATLKSHVARQHQMTRDSEDEDVDTEKCNLCRQIVPSRSIKSHRYYCKNKKEIAEKRANLKKVPVSPALSTVSCPPSISEDLDDKSCPICRKSFSNRQSVTRHLKTIHPGEKAARDMKPPEYHPSSAIPSTSTSSHLDVVNFHLKPTAVSSPIVSYRDTSCQICGEKFASRQSMIRHVGRKHPEAKDDPNVTAVRYISVESPSHQYACEDCGKRLTTRAALTTHRLRAHSTEQRHECSLCHKSYVVPSELRKHIQRVHEKASTTADVDELPDFDDVF